ncbi:hypothetical protein [Tessaracoccus sp. MC1756]|uniref:hypothetical protein n=1 Tax=Tessaracoccus sp. MC1756 TaxID=2760311 RepID=UPI001603ADCE|nr:hypothetical protein [Tessaracoccus sp. MC1756]MBB1510709.1 hypothetical protein [Tessaracoccus sp. MC1756]
MSEISFQALAPEKAIEQQLPTMSTGPAGLLLGSGPGGPVTMRLFRPEPTRVYLAVPEYLRWLVAFRAMCIGAHLSVIATDHRRWLTLADTVRACGGTIDVLNTPENLPGQGRPFRPSLIIDETGAVGTTARLGAWQAVAIVGDPSSPKAIADLRVCEMAMVSPLGPKSGENLRRAYALQSGQVKAVTDLDESEVVLASVRRVVKVRVPPSPTEYRLLFQSGPA